MANYYPTFSPVVGASSPGPTFTAPAWFNSPTGRKYRTGRIAIPSTAFEGSERYRALGRWSDPGLEAPAVPYIPPSVPFGIHGNWAPATMAFLRPMADVSMPGMNPDAPYIIEPYAPPRYLPAAPSSDALVWMRGGGLNNTVWDVTALRFVPLVASRALSFLPALLLAQGLVSLYDRLSNSVFGIVGGPGQNGDGSVICGTGPAEILKAASTGGYSSTFCALATNRTIQSVGLQGAVTPQTTNWLYGKPTTPGPTGQPRLECSYYVHTDPGEMPFTQHQVAELADASPGVYGAPDVVGVLATALPAIGALTGATPSPMPFGSIPWFSSAGFPFAREAGNLSLPAPAPFVSPELPYPLVSPLPGPVPSVIPVVDPWLPPGVTAPLEYPPLALDLNPGGEPYLVPASHPYGPPQTYPPLGPPTVMPFPDGPPEAPGWPPGHVDDPNAERPSRVKERKPKKRAQIALIHSLAIGQYATGTVRNLFNSLPKGCRSKMRPISRRTGRKNRRRISSMLSDIFSCLDAIDWDKFADLEANMILRYAAEGFLIKKGNQATPMLGRAGQYGPGFATDLYHMSPYQIGGQASPYGGPFRGHSDPLELVGAIFR